MPYANCDIKMFTYVHEWLHLPSYCLLPLSEPTIVKRIQDNLLGSLETRTADLENGCDCNVFFFYLFLYNHVSAFRLKYLTVLPLAGVTLSEL